MLVGGKEIEDFFEAFRSTSQKSSKYRNENLD